MSGAPGSLNITGDNIYVYLQGAGFNTSQANVILTLGAGELGIAADGDLIIDSGLLVFGAPTHNVYLYATGAVASVSYPGIGSSIIDWNVAPPDGWFLPIAHILDIRANNLYMRAVGHIGEFDWSGLPGFHCR